MTLKHEDERRVEASVELDAPVAVENSLEDRGNKTTLRLGLKDYLEQHRGTKRVVVRATCKIAGMSVADAWQRLAGPQALVAEGDRRILVSDG